jgi:hypothetical protein
MIPGRHLPLSMALFLASVNLNKNCMAFGIPLSRIIVIGRGITKMVKRARRSIKT